MNALNSPITDRIGQISRNDLNGTLKKLGKLYRLQFYDRITQKTFDAREEKFISFATEKSSEQAFLKDLTKVLFSDHPEPSEIRKRTERFIDSLKALGEALIISFGPPFADPRETKKISKLVGTLRMAMATGEQYRLKGEKEHLRLLDVHEMRDEWESFLNLLEAPIAAVLASTKMRKSSKVGRPPGSVREKSAQRMFALFPAKTKPHRVASLLARYFHGNGFRHVSESKLRVAINTAILGRRRSATLPKIDG